MTDAPVPVEFQIWSAERCALYFDVAKDAFLRTTRHAKGFPAQLTISEGKHPRWSAIAVIQWALRK